MCSIFYDTALLLYHFPSLGERWLELCLTQVINTPRPLTPHFALCLYKRMDSRATQQWNVFLYVCAVY